MKPQTKSAIPKLLVSPFAPVEVVDGHGLSGEDASFLSERERVIEAGRKTFLEVGRALLQIRDYQGGLLYKKRFGTFDAYCKERWDIGHSHAYRLMDAAEIYQSLSPRGDKRHEVPMPATEKQLRPLKRHPPKLRAKAWQNAIKTAGTAPVAARHVEKEVRTLMKAEGIKPPSVAKKTTDPVHRLPAHDVEQIRALLAKIRKAVVSGAVNRVPDWLDEIVCLLPGA